MNSFPTTFKIDDRVERFIDGVWCPGRVESISIFIRREQTSVDYKVILDKPDKYGVSMRITTALYLRRL